MSVRERLEDAMLLWNNGRKVVAWCQVLIAAAATSRVRFPRPMSDREAFMTFICELTPTIFDGKSPSVPGGITVAFYQDTRGDGASLDKIFYVHLRCNLVHEAIMPAEVQLCESRVVDGKLVADLSGIGKAHSPLTIPDFWVLHLAIAVANAPENAAECAGLFP
jgi:hypothetical protein